MCVSPRICGLPARFWLAACIFLLWRLHGISLTLPSFSQHSISFFHLPHFALSGPRQIPINHWYSQNTEGNPMSPPLFCLNKKGRFKLWFVCLFIDFCWALHSSLLSFLPFSYPSTFSQDPHAPIYSKDLVFFYYPCRLDLCMSLLGSWYEICIC